VNVSGYQPASSFFQKQVVWEGWKSCQSTLKNQLVAEAAPDRVFESHGSGFTFVTSRECNGLSRIGDFAT